MVKFLIFANIILAFSFFSGQKSMQDSSGVFDNVKLIEDDTSYANKGILKGRVINRVFLPGEILTFKLRYGFIKAGEAKMMVKYEVKDDGLRLYHLQTTARSASGFNWIYKVEDEVNSYVSYDYFYPIRFEKKLREGSYKADLYTEYYHSDSLAKVEFIRYESNMKVREKKEYDVKIPPLVQDILSSFYYIRTQNLEVGKSVFLTNNDKKKVYDLEVKVLKKETIEVEAGKFRTIVVEPVVKGEGLFKGKGKLLIWLTDDNKKIPVQMTTEIVVGHITSELTKIEGVIRPIASQIK